MRDEAANFLFAGHDTTATTIAFALFVLSEHPDIQERCFMEIDSTVTDEHPDYDSLAKLEYLDRVWKETLRLYPPAHFLGRKTDCDVNVGGYHIPPGVRNFILC
jgi:cytochrome P450